MAIVVYKCDTCKREIELPQNKKGLEVVQRCIITEGCRGKLGQQSIKYDHSRGSFPSTVVGLQDWAQRKVLFDFTQTISSTTWTVTHNLGTEPSIVVYIAKQSSSVVQTVTGITVVEKTTYQQVPLDELEVTIVNENQLIVTFPSPTFTSGQTGIVQCIARSTKPITNVAAPVATTVSYIQLTNSAELSIASIDNSTTLNLTLEFITPTGTVVPVNYVVDNIPSVTSPWTGYTNILVNGRNYTVRSFNVVNNITLFTNGTIPNGSTVRIVSIDTTATITNIDTASKTITISGDYTSTILTDDEITITDNTGGANGTYVVDAAVLVGSNTVIYLTDPITSTTSDGQLTHSRFRNGELLVLMADSPYSVVDVRLDEIVDPTTQASLQLPSLYYISGTNIFCAASLTKKIYPYIISI